MYRLKIAPHSVIQFEALFFRFKNQMMRPQKTYKNQKLSSAGRKKGNWFLRCRKR